MASVPDILGLTHIAITSVVQLVLVVKNRVASYKSLSFLIEEAEKRLRRIDSTTSSLSQLSEVTQLDSEIFTQAFCDLQDIERELLAVQQVVESNSTRATFFSSTKLTAKLRDINEKLGHIDRLFGLTTMAADVIARKVGHECADLRSRLNRMSTFMNQIMSTLQTHDSYFEMLSEALGISEANKPIILRCGRSYSDLLASENNAQVYYSLGRSYYNGDHERGIDYFQAARLFHAAFNDGMNPAAYYLGKLYANGQGVHQCFRAAFSYFDIGARNGHADSMYELCRCYHFGHGVAINRKKSMKYCEMAAQSGSGAGMWSAGYNALHGNNCKRDWPKAVRLIQNARQAGEIRANMELAQCYEHGIYVDRDHRHAFELLDEAQKSGDIMSMAYFARCFELGIGTERNTGKAAALYKSIMRRDTWLSKLYQSYYGILLVQGLGVRKNEQAGLRIIKSGLKVGHACGWAVYGDCYRFGYGVEKDAAKAVHCYSKAIASPGGQRGVRDAHFALAEMYETGDGLELNMGKAVHHYIRAANRMNSLAQWKAGSFYESGTEVDKHIHHAFYYFDLSARNGHTLAIRKAGEMYMKGVGIQRDRSKAIQLLEEAAKRGDLQARNILTRAQRVGIFCWSRRSTT